MNFDESQRCRDFTLSNARNSLGRAVHGVIWDWPN